ncbi:MAG: Fur family transcriptional regulator [Bacteroidota bacterium]
MPDSSSLLTALREAGMRITPQRLAICSLLASSREHPTAAQIYNELKPRFSSLSLATVYNTLEVLVHLGAINSLGKAGDDAVHYDADTGAHVNLACVSCSRIFDVPNRHVDPLAEEIRAASGFRLLGARLLYYGLCPDCQKAQSQAGPSRGVPLPASKRQKPGQRDLPGGEE